MKLDFHTLPDYQFPYWMTHETVPAVDDFNKILDINQWAGFRFGELGTTWGFERVQDTSGAPKGLNPVRVRLYHTKITYSWRFKNKEDAMLFKLTWGGA